MEYVRKKTKPTAATSQGSFGMYSREVSLYRAHRLVPRMVGNEEFCVLPQEHPMHNAFKSSSIISTFCNGGTLHRLSKVFCDGHKLIPEALLWHLLDQMLEVLGFLHRGYPSIYHADIHFENIFLHFADDSQQFPDFYLGDFGQAHMLDQFIWEVGPNPARMALNTRTDWKLSAGIFSDMRMLINTVKHAIFASRWGFKSQYSHVEEVQALANISPEFTAVLEQLMKASVLRQAIPHPTHGDNHQSDHSERYEQLIRIRRAVSRKAKVVRSALADLPDLQWTRPGRSQEDAVAGSHEKLQGSYEPTLFSSRAELLSQAERIPGPWRIARVDGTSNKVLGVEKLTFGFHLPHVSSRCLNGCDCRVRRQNGQRVAFNWDDHCRIPQLVETEVDRIGMDALREEAGTILPGSPVPAHFELDPEWTAERLGSAAEHPMDESV
ncbi:hypothetical protein LTR84_010544 [Exophiala bonariae]|uniref:non-specific serine/threonine protein kinase n=1 Tax=Exophiala bonariae TaxID=1690606 RepID=A0AAV9MVD7_9EURO|nr:hypothetical protein LTR84_010544 [Exophiala bonariae]